MRILVIEDETHIAAYLRKSLEAEGFAVDVAADGPAGLGAALEGGYDAITLDILLPGKNGYQVCKELRQAGVTTPILMLTAKDGDYDEADALDVGADDFLRKPFSLVVLVARIRALIRRSGVMQGASTGIGGLELDTARHCAVRDGVRIELTPREYSLLEFLVFHAGQTLSKAQIFEHVWGFEAVPNDNVVEVYIGYLRKKIDAPFDKPLIHTQRGVGYRLSND